MVNWPNHDQALLTLLHDVRNGDEVLLGMSYTDDFWKDFALTFSERRQLNFEPAVIAVRVDKLRSIYHDFRNNLATLQHPSMNQAEFVRLLRRCFHNEKVVKILTKYTRRASRHYGSTSRSWPYPAQATSSSTTGSLQPSLSHEEQAEEITSVLDDLNSHHGLSVGLLMELPQNTTLCKCRRQAVLKKSHSKHNSGRMYYNCPKANGGDFGCGFFSWANEPQEGENCGLGNSVAGISSSSCGPSSSGLQRDSSSSPGPSSSGLQRGSSSSPGPSSFPGPSSNCVNCKLLVAKIKILEAQLMMRGHEDSSQLAAIIQEVSAQLDGLLVQDE